MRLVQLYDVNSFADLGGILLHVRWVEKVRMNAWVCMYGSTLWMENNVNTKSVFSVLSV